MQCDAILAGARADIEHANDDWVPALRRRDAETIAAAYVDDGIFIAPDGTVTRGRAAIVAMYAARFPKMKEIHDGGIVQDGTAVIDDSTIYEWGHAWLETGQPPVRSGGRYLTVWKRQTDGHWRITRNMAF
ncbi:MAG TPA: SgcJ/EcaC family oxidoreductase [Thermoanaerobaculia bacterium]|nr:SgcJ/EcaC family oxidoreductase [Thermoanaerobaculia bacterium]